MNKQLILSTRGKYSNKNILIGGILSLIAATFFVIYYPNLTDSALGFVIYVVVIGIFTLPYSRSLQLKKSFVDLYEECIVGISVSQTYLIDNSCKFILKYEQITNVEILNSTVRIYFDGGNYLVQASDCEHQVMKIIKQQANLNTNIS